MSADFIKNPVKLVILTLKNNKLVPAKTIVFAGNAPAQVQKAMESLKQLIEARAPNSLSFSIDNSTGKTIVRITDAQTGEMIRQIPSEEMLEIARSVDRMQGMLLQQQA